MNWGIINCPNDSDTITNVLSNFKDRNEVTIVELGVGEGNTGNRIVDYLKTLNIKNITYYGIDNKSLSLISEEYTQHKFEHKEMKFILGDRNNIPECDFILLDACHCAECVFLDGIAASKLVRKNGYMAFHDTSLLWQYPYDNNQGSWQHYESGHQIRPLNVVEGIVSGRCKWDGDWQLITQTGDELSWGGVRIYQKG